MMQVDNDHSFTSQESFTSVLVEWRLSLILRLQDEDFTYPKEVRLVHQAGKDQLERPSRGHYKINTEFMGG